MNHQPWHESTIMSRLDTIARTKTTKTLCGRRVDLSSANANEPIECSECQKIMESNQNALKEMESLLNKIRAEEGRTPLS